jgi:hypothetical protein
MQGIGSGRTFGDGGQIEDGERNNHAGKSTIICARNSIINRLLNIRHSNHNLTDKLRSLKSTN